MVVFVWNKKKLALDVSANRVKAACAELTELCDSDVSEVMKISIRHSETLKMILQTNNTEYDFRYINILNLLQPYFAEV